MISRIRIKGYKSFKDIDVPIKPLTIIFGPNAAGKSNFLDAITLLSRAVKCHNLEEAFSRHRGLPFESFYYGDTGLQSNLGKQQVSCTMEVDVSISPAVRDRVSELVRAKRRGIDSSRTKKRVVSDIYLRYRITIEYQPSTGYLRVMDERLSAIKQNGQEKRRTPFLERVKNSLHLRMEKQSHPVFHDIGLDHTIVSLPLYAPYYPHITAFRMEMERWKPYRHMPSVLMDAGGPAVDGTAVGTHGENLASFIKLLKRGSGESFGAFNDMLSRIISEDTRIDIDSGSGDHPGFVLKEDGNWFSARLISRGVLRLIGLLASINASNPPGMIALEEPQTGIQHSNIRQFCEEVKTAVRDHGKQIIITTHSPLIPEYFDDDNLYVCRKEGHSTSIIPFHTYGPVFRQQYIDHVLEKSALKGGLGD